MDDLAPQLLRRAVEEGSRALAEDRFLASEIVGGGYSARFKVARNTAFAAAILENRAPDSQLALRSMQDLIADHATLARRELMDQKDHQAALELLLLAGLKSEVTRYGAKPMRGKGIPERLSFVKRIAAGESAFTEMPWVRCYVDLFELLRDPDDARDRKPYLVSNPTIIGMAALLDLFVYNPGKPIDWMRAAELVGY